MTDITLSNIGSGYNLNKINDNFETIEDVVNTELLHTEGGNNTMRQALDMNSNRIINLPLASVDTEPVTKGQLGDAIDRLAAIVAELSSSEYGNADNVVYTDPDGNVKTLSSLLDNGDGVLYTATVGLSQIGTLGVDWDEYKYFWIPEFWPNSKIGGGTFFWDASRSKSEHTGVSIIDPVKIAELGGVGTFGSYFEAAESGNGCLVLIGSATIYNAGAIDHPNASNATAINAAIRDGARGVATELRISEPVVLPSRRVYFEGLKLKPTASFTGEYMIDATEGLNFENLHVSADGQDILIMDRDDTENLASGYFRDFIVSDTPAGIRTDVTFRGVDNLDGKRLTLLDLRGRSAIRARGCSDGEIVGVRSIGCGARTFAISDNSNNFFVRKIVIRTDVGNTGDAASGEHLYGTGELAPGITNCGYEDVFIHAPDASPGRNLIKFSRNSLGCSLVGAYGTLKSGYGFNGAVSAQGSPNTLFKDIHLISTQEDDSGQGSLLFCRPHPVTMTQSSGTKFINVHIEGTLPGVQLAGSDSEEVPGTVEDVTFKNVSVKTKRDAFSFMGGSYKNIQVKDSEFRSSEWRGLNTNYAEVFDSEGITFENVTLKTEAAIHAARFPSNMVGAQVLRCTFERVYVAEGIIVMISSGDKLVAHNTFNGGAVSGVTLTTLAENFNVVLP